LCVIALATLLAPLPLRAQTVPLPGGEAEFEYGDFTGPRRSDVEWPVGRVNWMLEMNRTVRYLDTWQERDPGPEFGGMIEAESGPLGGVIQTDNTLEAIWVWSHYRRITGDTSFDDNIRDAWIYCENWPAWQEESPNYYRVHNCAWALTAESEYRAATGDTTFLAYGRTSAEYIRNTPLFLNQNQFLNAMVQGWAAGQLYIYAEELNQAAWRQKALDYGETMIDWVAVNPARNLSFETWAMSAGTLAWGICASVFADDPVRGAQWIAGNGALVDTFQVWYDVPNDGFDWDNSWNVGYCNAHFAMGEISGDPYYTGIGEKLTRKLNAYDTDDDGGIMATTQDPPTIDMSWVSSYLAKFGMARLLGDPPATDAGLLAFTSPADGDTFALGTPIPLRVQATNYGLQALSGVEVAADGLDPATIDLDFVEVEEVELDPGSLYPAGRHQITVYTSHPADAVPSNDSLTVTFFVGDPAALGEPVSERPAILAVQPNPLISPATISLAVPAGQTADVGLFALDGSRLTGWTAEAGQSRVARFIWDGRDAAGRPAPAGLYFVRARCGDISVTERIVKLGAPR